MTKGNIIRLIDEWDLYDVPAAREEFEEHGHKGNYFFFVVKDDNKNTVGYFIAKAREKEVVIETLDLFDELEEKQDYRGTIISNLREYIKEIKNCSGTRMFFNVSFA